MGLETNLEASQTEAEYGPYPDALEFNEPLGPETTQLEGHEPVNEFFDEAAVALNSHKTHMADFVQKLTTYQGSKKQLIQTWLNAALSPLNPAPFQWPYPEMQDLFMVFDELNSAKFILMVHGLADAGVLTLHKPLMMSTPATESERELQKQMSSLTSGPEINLGERPLPPQETL